MQMTEADWKWNIRLYHPTCSPKWIQSRFQLVSLYTHAHTSESTRMALRAGTLRLNLLVNRCHFHKFPSFVGVRQLSDQVSCKPVTSSAPETTGDHLIYTQEHFALKESLRKVCRTASIVASLRRYHTNSDILCCLAGDNRIFYYPCLL